MHLGDLARSLAGQESGGNTNPLSSIRNSSFCSCTSFSVSLTDQQSAKAFAPATLKGKNFKGKIAM
jgi:hypothetical protein